MNQEEGLTLEQSVCNVIVEEIQTLIYQDVIQSCEGCKIGHPSQIRHMLCLFTPTDQWVELFIDTAVIRLDLNKVQETYISEKQLDDTEAAKVRELIADIKQQIHGQSSDSKEEWITVWAERVKRIWKNGHY